MVDERHLSIGEGVYTSGGDRIGTIVDITGGSVQVKLDDDTTVTTKGHDERSLGYGEVELMWRCSRCGELGQIEEMPDSCPSCGADKEELYYWTED